MEPHPGILVHRIPADGLGGLIFALGMASVVFLAIPTLRPLMAFGLLAGALSAPLLHRLHTHH